MGKCSHSCTICLGLRNVLEGLIDGSWAEDRTLFRPIYDSLLSGGWADPYFILADFRSYADAQKRIEEAYRDRRRWVKMAFMNTACAGKFSADRTIREYVEDIWHLKSITVPEDTEEKWMIRS